MDRRNPGSIFLAHLASGRCGGTIRDNQSLSGYAVSNTGAWIREGRNRLGLSQADVALKVCEDGEVGRCALWSGQVSVCGFQKALHRLRPRSPARDLPRFMYYVLRTAAKSSAFNDGHQSTIAHLTGDKLKAHRFPFPPACEQTSIVRFLDGTSEQVERSVSAALREIALLGEYRTRLIADVVTGKLDVREAAARLPEEVEEVEPLDVADDGSGAEDEAVEGVDEATGEADA